MIVILLIVLLILLTAITAMTFHMFTLLYFHLGDNHTILHLKTQESL